MRLPIGIVTVRGDALLTEVILFAALVALALALAVAQGQVALLGEAQASRRNRFEGAS